MGRNMWLSRKHYKFTRRWFKNRNLETFRKFVHPEWAGKPVSYLEIGVFEGMSICWMLENVLTHPKSTAVGIDPWLITTKLSPDFMEGVRLRAMNNVSPWWEEGRCDLIQGNSCEVLRRMVRANGFRGITKDSVDLCMIDGDHNDYAVLDDARLCLQLVRPAGWLMFDDVENDVGKARHVKGGLELFKTEVGDRIEFVWKHRYMECWKRVR